MYGEEGKLYRILMGKPKGKRLLRRPREWDKNGSWGDWLGGYGVDSPDLGWGSVVGSCEHSDEPLGSGTT
jgi:hypothetical protein